MLTNQFLLIDGALRQTAIKDLYANYQGLKIMPLYIGTPYHDNYDIGPILVGNFNQTNLRNEINQYDLTITASIIESTQDINTIAEHLQQFLVVDDEAGSHALFRFADPLITWYWLNSYGEQVHSQIMRPIKQWQVIKPIPHWQTNKTPQWQTFTKAENSIKLQTPINFLLPPQTEALSKANDFRFKNRLYDWLKEHKAHAFENKAEDQISYWMNYCYEEAEAFNLISERSFAMWFELSADYDYDFATRNEDNPYKEWFTQNPREKGLPTEVTIQNFYDHITLYRDTGKGI